MKTLFCKNGKNVRLEDKENLIFVIDNIFYNQHG